MTALPTPAVVADLIAPESRIPDLEARITAAQALLRAIVNGSHLGTNTHTQALEVLQALEGK